MDLFGLETLMPDGVNLAYELETFGWKQRKVWHKRKGK